MARPIHLQGRWERSTASLEVFWEKKNLLLLPAFELRICHPVTYSINSYEIRLWTLIMICNEKFLQQHKTTSDIAEILSLCAAWTTSVNVSTSPRNLASTNLHSVIAAIIRILSVTSASLRRSEEDVGHSACSTKVLIAYLKQLAFWLISGGFATRGASWVPSRTITSFH